MPSEVLRYEADIKQLREALDDIKRGQKQVQEDTKDQTDKLTSHWQAAKTGIGVAAAGIAANLAMNLAGKAVQFIGESGAAAVDMAETLSKTNVIFGSETAGGLVAWAEGAATAMGQSKQQALDAASTFATFGKSAGLAGNDLSSFAKENAQMASDLASFHNTSPEEAIQAIGAALRGEAEPIRKYGILLDDATLRNQALKMGLISTTKDALTPAQKVLAAQAQIMAQAGDANGDFARTSDGVANKQRILAAELENAKAKLGEGLQPAMLAITQIASQYLVPVITLVAAKFGELSVWLQEHKTVMTVVAAVIGGLLVGAFVAWAVSAASAAVATIAATWPVIAIAAAIVGLVAGIIWAYQNVDWFRESLQAIGRFMSDTLWPIIQRVASIIADYFILQIKAAIWYVQLWWQALQTAYDVIYWAFVHIRDIATSVLGWIGDRIGDLKNVLAGVADAISAPFRAAFNAVASAWNNTVGRLSFTVPSWVPALGGRGWDVPDIPTFDTGAFVKNPTLALLSQNRVPEFVSPEPQLRRVISEEVARGGGRAGPAVMQEIHLHGATALTKRDLDDMQREAAFRVRVGAA
jgi:hypothetical protein